MTCLVSQSTIKLYTCYIFILLLFKTLSTFPRSCWNTFIMNKIHSNEKVESYLYNKRTSIKVLKWLGYFPITFNSGIVEFTMQYFSWTFLFQVLRVVVILFFFAGNMVININPNITKKLNLSVTEKNKTENLTNNESSLVEISYKYDFRSLIDYSLIIQFFLYLVTITILCRSFAKQITKLSSIMLEFDIQVDENINGKLNGFGNLYIGCFFELIYHFIYLTRDIVFGIVHPDWWMETLGTRIFDIIHGVSYIWILIVQTTFDFLLTISFFAIKQRFSILRNVMYGPHKFNAILSLMDEILAYFQFAFGEIVTLHVSFYTFDLLTKTFNIIILGARGNIVITLQLIPSLIGTLIRIYHRKR